MGIIIAFGALFGAMVGAGIGTALALIIATVRKFNDKEENSWWLGFIASFMVCAPISALIGAFVVASDMLH